jgi:copper chaperone
MQNVELVASDISCGHCKMTIEKGLGEVTGVGSVEVNIESKEVGVSFDESLTNVEDLREHLATLGYPAELVKR